MKAFMKYITELHIFKCAVCRAEWQTGAINAIKNIIECNFLNWSEVRNKNIYIIWLNTLSVPFTVLCFSISFTEDKSIYVVIKDVTFYCLCYRSYFLLTSCFASYIQTDIAKSMILNSFYQSEHFYYYKRGMHCYRLVLCRQI